MQIGIHDRGRGPEIIGTRITVYDIMDYYTKGWQHASIAVTLGLCSAQVKAAIEYIEAHKEEVNAAYQRMLDFAARGNSPEVRAKLVETRKRFLARLNDKQWQLLEEIEREAAHEGTAGGH
jgi:uncharacterized protein (DUF433 family)